MRTNGLADSSKVRSFERMDAVRLSSDRKDTLGAFVRHVVSEEHLVENKHLMSPETTIDVIWETLKDAIVKISGLIEYTVAALLTQESHIVASRTNIRREACFKASSRSQFKTN